jgi:hypothetical protein
MGTVERARSRSKSLTSSGINVVGVKKNPLVCMKFSRQQANATDHRFAAETSMRPSRPRPPRRSPSACRLLDVCRCAGNWQGTGCTQRRPVAASGGGHLQSLKPALACPARERCRSCGRRAQTTYTYDNGAGRFHLCKLGATSPGARRGPVWAVVIVDGGHGQDAGGAAGSSASGWQEVRRRRAWRRVAGNAVNDAACSPGATVRGNPTSNASALRPCPSTATRTTCAASRRLGTHQGQGHRH